jgi:hypothetical protein
MAGSSYLLYGVTKRLSTGTQRVQLVTKCLNYFFLKARNSTVPNYEARWSQALITWETVLRYGQKLKAFKLSCFRQCYALINPVMCAKEGGSAD